MTTKKTSKTSKASPELIDIPEAVDKVQRISSAAAAQFFDMEDSIGATLLALIVASNVVLIGPPGTGKTALLQFLAACIEDAKVWTNQFHAETRWSDLTGERDILALQEGRIDFNRANTLVDCDIGVCDEVFKGPGKTLNAGLSLFHPGERRYRAQEQGEGAYVKAPLRSVFAASNEFPQGVGERRKGPDDMGALYDRFEFRVITEQVTNHAKRRAILALGRARRSGTLPAPPTITLPEVEALGAAALEVQFPEGIEDMLFSAVDELRGRKIEITTRKEEHLSYALQASALLRGRHAVGMADLKAVMPHMAWEVPKERSVVKEVLGALGNEADQLGDILADRMIRNVRMMTETLAGWDSPAEISGPQLAEHIEPFTYEFKDIFSAWDNASEKPMDPEGFQANRDICEELRGTAREDFAEWMAQRQKLLEADSSSAMDF